ncbi:MAG: putative hydro-lyase [Pseudomonadota bacterium]
MTELFATSEELRSAARAGRHTGHTAGQAPGFVQGNVVILPSNYADDFARYCQENPKPCPLLGQAERGDPALPDLGEAIDIRGDLPSYRVFRHGRRNGDVSDISDLWRDDFVTFVLGCSFSFEEALMEAGLSLRHIEQDTTVPMYRSRILTREAGPFGGPMVVSMRPFTPDDAKRAATITGRFPHAHGAPVHIGKPAEIGIAALDEPDFGDRAALRPGEVPLFWACGVTPQVALERARPEICITHTPGAMLVTDLKNAELMTGAP